MIYPIDDTQAGYSALHWAVKNGYYDCALLLIHANACIEIKGYVSTLDVHTLYYHDHTHDISY